MAAWAASAAACFAFIFSFITSSSAFFAFSTVFALNVFFTACAAFSDAFSDQEHVRVAVNQEHVEFDMPVKKDDEIAFFPPMTGG